MMPRNNNRIIGFTLVELLVVIAIIGLIASLSVIAFGNARQKSRDSKRVSDIKQVQTALELFFSDQGRYPTATEWNTGSLYSTSTLTGTTTYMENIPESPDVIDGDCLTDQYLYNVTGDLTEYYISFCLGGTVSANIGPGDLRATNMGISPDYSWQVVGSSGFTTDAILYDISLQSYNGEPYVGIQNITYGHSPSVMKYNGSAWVYVGSPVAYPTYDYYNFLKIINGVPYIFFTGNTMSYKTAVTKYDGSNWVSVGLLPFSSGQGGYLTMDGYNGVPYVSFTDAAYSNRAVVMKYDGDNWVAIGLPGFTASSVTYLELRLNGSTPYVAFRDSSCGYQVSVMKYNGSDWEYVGPPCFSTNFYGDPTNVISLRHYDGVPYVSFVNTNAKPSVMKYNGSSWEYVGIDSFTPNTAYYTTMDIYKGTPYVVFADGANSSKASAMKYNGSSWVYVGQPGFSSERVYSPHIDITDGYFYIAFRNHPITKPTVMKFSELE